MNSEPNFFYDLSERLRLLISDACAEKERDWLSFVRSTKRAEVVLCGPGEEQANKAALQLQFLGYEVIGDTDGTFAVSDPQNEILVFKLPSRIAASYLLRISDMDFRTTIKLFDGLCASFFNRKSIDSFVPDSFQVIPQLHERMSATRAEIKLIKAGAAQTGSGYEMRLEYKGLYHSGDPIRTEKRVRQRNIQMNKTEEGVL